MNEQTNEEPGGWEPSQEAVTGWLGFVERQRKGTEALGTSVLPTPAFPTPPRLPQLWSDPDEGVRVNSIWWLQEMVFKRGKQWRHRKSSCLLGQMLISLGNCKTQSQRHLPKVARQLE